MATFAVIKTGGKQYLITPGQKLKIEKLDADGGAVVSFSEVLLVVDGVTAEIGMPFIGGAKVEAEVLGQGRERKKIVFKYHAKARYRKKKGHRQPYTEIEIKKIAMK
ncbi:MAG: 50S ribosomal protein L21 [Candidatus Sungbacteria bacterium]|nr:50S ribosomal protein L21 [Candidatus Sungbacteria bacterium]